MSTCVTLLRVFFLTCQNKSLNAPSGSDHYVLYYPPLSGTPPLEAVTGVTCLYFIREIFPNHTCAAVDTNFTLKEFGSQLFMTKGHGLGILAKRCEYKKGLGHNFIMKQNAFTLLRGPKPFYARDGHFGF